MSILGLSSALGAAYDIRKSENTTSVSGMSNEEIWKQINGNPSDEEIAMHLVKLGFEYESQLFNAVDGVARRSFLNHLNAALDQEYSDYSKSLGMKANGNLEDDLLIEQDDNEIAGTNMEQVYSDLVGKLGANVYETALDTPTNYSLRVADSPVEGGFTINQAEAVHNWYVGAANTWVIDAVYDKLFG